MSVAERIKMKNITSYILWPLALFVAFVVFIPSLFFKFSGAAESRHIFMTVGEFLGMGFFEPYGRYLIGTAELMASILLLIPRSQIYGALLSLGVLSGAIFFHLFSPLGVIVRWTENGTAQQDSTLFLLAIASFIAVGIIAWTRRRSLNWLFNRGSESETEHRIKTVEPG